jgi:transposase InsO family protein
MRRCHAASAGTTSANSAPKPARRHRLPVRPARLARGVGGVGRAIAVRIDLVVANEEPALARVILAVAARCPRDRRRQLYVILDVFSRFVVGWMVALRESATLAQISPSIGVDAKRSRPAS